MSNEEVLALGLGAAFVVLIFAYKYKTTNNPAPSQPSAGFTTPANPARLYHDWLDNLAKDKAALTDAERRAQYFADQLLSMHAAVYQPKPLEATATDPKAPAPTA